MSHLAQAVAAALEPLSPTIDGDRVRVQINAARAEPLEFVLIPDTNQVVGFTTNVEPTPSVDAALDALSNAITDTIASFDPYDRDALRLWEAVFANPLPPELRRRLAARAHDCASARLAKAEARKARALQAITDAIQDTATCKRLDALADDALAQAIADRKEP